MKIYIMTLCVVFSTFTFAGKALNSQRSIWDGDYDQPDLRDPNYFVHRFKRMPAEFIGNCGKASQILNNRTAYLRIRDSYLKNEIKNKLMKNEEFTAMSFIWNGQSKYLTVLDKKFIHEYCGQSNKDKIPIYVDGFQIDIQFEHEYEQEIIIDKVHMN